jgi:CDP-archaeol synthase
MIFTMRLLSGPVLSALLMVTVANVAPWASGRLFGRFGSQPLDCGVRLADGTRLLGDHKTWRGVLAGELACAVIGRLLEHSWALGAAFATLSLAADAASSLVKRRLHLAPGAEMAGLDQLPEALLPLLVLATWLRISLLEALTIALAFLFLDLAATPLRRGATGSR